MNRGGCTGRKMIPLIAAAALAVAPCAPSSAESPRLTYPARQVTVPIKVDGRLGEWQGAESVVLIKQAQWQAAREGEQYAGPRDLAARFRLAWDRSNLYLALEAYDDDLSPPAGVQSLLQGDCVVVALDVGNEGGQGYDENDYEFGFAYTPGGVAAWRWFPLERAGPLGGARVALVRETKPLAGDAGVPPVKLTYEAAIPWTEFPGAAAEPGATFGFNLALNDVDAGERRGWLQWSGGMMGVKDPSCFRKVVLMGPARAHPAAPAARQ